MKRQLIGYVALAIFAAIILLIGLYKKKELKKNYQITVGTVYDLETSSKSPDIFVKFKYKTNQQTFEHNSSIPCPHANCLRFLYSLLKGSSLPVVYQKNNFINCKMILSQQESDEYKISLTPDQKRIIQSIDSIVNKK